MQRLILILLGFLALVTYIRAYEKTEAAITPAVITAEVTGESMEIIR